MGVVLSSLREGGELSLMHGDNSLGGINWPRLWLLFLRNVNTYRVGSWNVTTITAIHQWWGQLQREWHNCELGINYKLRVRPKFRGCTGRDGGEVKLLTAMSSNVYTQAAGSELKRGLALAKHLYAEIWYDFSSQLFSANQISLTMTLPRLT